MGSEAVDTDGESLEKRLTRYDNTIRILVWLLVCALAAVLVSFACLLANANALDADMDLVAAARGGG